jgi:hypothetical protein
MTDEELAEYKKLYKQVWGEKDYQERFGEDWFERSQETIKTRWLLKNQKLKN